jgi:hypothetical protein
MCNEEANTPIGHRAGCADGLHASSKRKVRVRKLGHVFQQHPKQRSQETLQQDLSHTTTLDRVGIKNEYPGIEAEEAILSILLDANAVQALQDANIVAASPGTCNTCPSLRTRSSRSKLVV